MGWIITLLDILARVAGVFIKKPAGPSPEVQEAEKAASAETGLAVETKSDATIAQARAASDAVDRDAARNPGGLRDPSPDSRD